MALAISTPNISYDFNPVIFCIFSISKLQIHNDTKVRGTWPNLNPEILLLTPTVHFENTNVGLDYVFRHPHSTQTCEIEIST